MTGFVYNDLKPNNVMAPEPHPAPPAPRLVVVGGGGWGWGGGLLLQEVFWGSALRPPAPSAPLAREVSPPSAQAPTAALAVARFAPRGGVRRVAIACVV